MKLIRYRTVDELKKVADELGITLYHTSVSSSFRIYDEKRMTKELHIFYKK